MIKWLLAPSKLPKAPPWWVVFGFGAVYNAVTGCWWGAGFCIAIYCLLGAGVWAIDRYVDERS